MNNEFINADMLLDTKTPDGFGRAFMLLHRLTKNDGWRRTAFMAFQLTKMTFQDNYKPHDEDVVGMEGVMKRWTFEVKALIDELEQLDIIRHRLRQAREELTDQMLPIMNARL